MRSTTKVFLLFSIFISYLQLKSQNETFNFIGIKTPGGDSIHFINPLIRLNWQASLYKNNRSFIEFKNCHPDTITSLENADKMILKSIFSIDSTLVNKIFCINYVCYGDLKVKINGKQVINEKISKNKLPFFSHFTKSGVYTSFEKKENQIEVELSGEDVPSVGEMLFQFRELKFHKGKLEAEAIERTLQIIKLIFFMAIGLVVFIQYYFYRKSRENFYFAVFCILYTFFLLTDIFHFSLALRSLFIVISALGTGALTNYLSLVLTDNLYKKWPSIVLLLGSLFSTLLAFIISDNFFAGNIFFALLYSGYNIFICLYLLFQGSNKRKWEAKYITFSFFTVVGLYVVLALISFILELSKNKSLSETINYFYDFPIYLLPITLVVMIGKRSGLNQSDLISKYEEIKILSEENLAKEKEKQTILSEQNQLLENKVQERTSELVQQKHIVEEKQKEIIESINYAKRLQQAILPPLELIDSHLPDNFIFYRPKDIIAGDFYWMERTDDLIFIAAADCTRHGVPGALVSVVYSNALNRAVKEFRMKLPGEILDKTRELVLETFEKSTDEVKDGMDISLLCIDRKKQKVIWSGAYNPLWYVESKENDSYELKEIKADKQPIGKSDHYRRFTSHEINFLKGTTFYLFTDGYADQFGGPSGKKFKYKPLQELLLSVQNVSLREQAVILNDAFEKWKNNLDQVDDVCLIGIKL